MNNQTYKPGQAVWVCHLVTESNSKDKPCPRAVVTEREFYREARPSWANGELRFVCGPKGKAHHEPGPAPFGVAYGPASVYPSRLDAVKALRAKIDAKVQSLLDLKHSFDSDLTA